MAVTKDTSPAAAACQQAIAYVLNGDKTDELYPHGGTAAVIQGVNSLP